MRPTSAHKQCCRSQTKIHVHATLIFYHCLLPLHSWTAFCRCHHWQQSCCAVHHCCRFAHGQACCRQAMRIFPQTSGPGVPYRTCDCSQCTPEILDTDAQQLRNAYKRIKLLQVMVEDSIDPSPLRVILVGAAYGSQWLPCMKHRTMNISSVVLVSAARCSVRRKR